MCPTCASLGLAAVKINKKAVLSQRWPRDVPYYPIYMDALKNIRESLATPTATFPEIVNGLFLWSIVRKCVQNLKFVALPVPEIIGGTLKRWAVPGYAHAAFSQNFLMAFCSDGPCEYETAKFVVCSFTRSWGNNSGWAFIGWLLWDGHL